MINNIDLANLVANFMKEDISDQLKLETLSSWLNQIIAKHDGIIMDKAMAEQYSESTRIIGTAINSISL